MYYGGPLGSLLACVDLELPSLRSHLHLQKEMGTCCAIGEGGEPLPRQGACGLGDPPFFIPGNKCLVGTSLWTMKCGAQP